MDVHASIPTLAPYKGSRKKSSSLNGRAIKRGGGKGPDIKEKELFLKLCCHLKIRIILLQTTRNMDITLSPNFFFFFYLLPDININIFIKIFIMYQRETCPDRHFKFNIQEEQKKHFLVVKPPGPLVPLPELVVTCALLFLSKENSKTKKFK